MRSPPRGRRRWRSRRPGDGRRRPGARRSRSRRSAFERRLTRTRGSAALFLDEGRDLHTGDAAQAVDDALGLFFAGAGRGVVGEPQRGDQGAAAGQRPGAGDGARPEAQRFDRALLVEQSRTPGSRRRRARSARPPSRRWRRWCCRGGSGRCRTRCRRTGPSAAAGTAAGREHGRCRRPARWCCSPRRARRPRHRSACCRDDGRC